MAHLRLCAQTQRYEEERRPQHFVSFVRLISVHQLMGHAMRIVAGTNERLMYTSAIYSCAQVVREIYIPMFSLSNDNQLEEEKN
jgi:hypothetical protein